MFDETCNLRTTLVGDGCSKFNPRRSIELQIEAVTEALDELSEYRKSEKDRVTRVAYNAVCDMLDVLQSVLYQKLNTKEQTCKKQET